MARRRSTSPNFKSIDSYAGLRPYVDSFVGEYLTLLILFGRPGTGKSQLLRQALSNQRHNYIQGNSSAFGLYTCLYHHQNELTVIDDVDGLYADADAVRLLKCLCQTDVEKVLQWNTLAADGSDGRPPRSFQTSSRVAIIANEWKTLNVNLEAVADRGHLINFEPTAAEVHRQVATYFYDQVVFDWIGEHLHLFPRLSMRTYERAAELRSASEAGIGCIDWRDVLLGEGIDPKTLVVAGLLEQFENPQEQIEAFTAGGHGGRTTFYNHRRELNRPEHQPPMEPIVLARAGMRLIRSPDREELQAVSEVPQPPIGSIPVSTPTAAMREEDRLETSTSLIIPDRLAQVISPRPRRSIRRSVRVDSGEFR